MKKYSLLIFVLLFLAFIFSTYLYLCIEVELKNVIERYGVHYNQLIDSAFRIRIIAQIQLGLVVFLMVLSIFGYFTRRR